MDQDKGGTTLNLEQLQSMSDDELNELATVKVMGWTKRIDPDTEAIKGYVKTNGEEISYRDFDPTDDLNDAWRLMNIVKDSLFSERKDFMDTLQHVVTSRYPLKKMMIAWPDAIWHMTPRDITIASILSKE